MFRITLLILLVIELSQSRFSGAETSSKVGPQTSKTTTSSAEKSSPSDTDQEFKAKLGESIRKAEKSIKVIRKQIIESQNAPFLPDLYVQLGDLLSQKAITLYYIKMENDAKIDGGATKVEEAQPVVIATREAIEVYKTVLKDFPTYPKRADVSYKLAVCFKSIDDVPQFIITTSKLIKDYPNTDYSMRGSLLLGRHFLDDHEFDQALALLTPIAASKLTYEKNLARHWIGLIYLGKEKYSDALHEFEEVVSDPDLKEQENPYDLKKASGHGSTDLKREALIDSIRAYTAVYDKNPDPVAYYQKLSPTETYFQEVMEKLALRYVTIKKYEQSVKLLRTTSERTSDPQKVVNIYREVLLLMPVEQRIAISVEEMSFVLHKFNLWQSYYKIPLQTHSDSFWFFEKQIRDIATRNHDLAKVENNPARKRKLLEQARDYYHLYLPFFDHTASTVKLATNLADVYYLLGEYLKSGDLYLKIYQGDYGKSPNRKAVIENSIISLQRDKSEGFYEKVRAKGLLIKAVSSLQAGFIASKNDPKLELLRLKTEYEQGFVPKAIDDLYAFAKKNRATPQAIDAGDIIMDYYNTLNDFQGLQFWSDKLMNLKLPGSAFNAKLSKIKSQAKSKLVQEKVKAISGYDEFSEGKSYLAAALQSSDASLKDAAIQEALSKSKREHDFKTFLEAATALAQNEKNPQKRAAILRSVAQENIKVGKFYTGIAELREAASDPALDATTRRNLMEDSVNTAIMLHDASELKLVVSDPKFAQVSGLVKGRVRDQIADALDAPVELKADEVSIVFKMGLTEDVLLGLYKARNKLSPQLKTRVDAEVAAHCSSQSRQLVCLWTQFSALERIRTNAIKTLRSAPADLKSLEAYASQFMETTRRYQVLEGGGDAHLETAVSIRGKELYTEFSNYLTRVANANPNLRNEILQKARESTASAQVYEQKCSTLSAKATGANPAMKFCATKTAPALEAMLYWGRGLSVSAPHSDSSSGDTENMQKSVFSSDKDADPMLKLASNEFDSQDYYHAAALSGYGATSFKSREGEFKVILGCALQKLGYFTEASFHLKSAGDYQNKKTACLDALQKLRVQ